MQRDSKKSMRSLQVLVIFTICFLIIIQPSFGDLESPRKQIKSGIMPEKITCEEGLVLMLKISGLPACVKPTTAEKLEERGWKQVIQKSEEAEELEERSGKQVIQKSEGKTSHSEV